MLKQGDVTSRERYCLRGLFLIGIKSIFCTDVSKVGRKMDRKNRVLRKEEKMGAMGKGAPQQTNYFHTPSIAHALLQIGTQCTHHFSIS